LTSSTTAPNVRAANATSQDGTHRRRSGSIQHQMRAAKALQRAGYRRIAKDQHLIVKGTYGPLADGEVERAKAWGTELASLCTAR
jgi:hypothetical protein